PPRRPRSFPTRRSSDLAGTGRAREQDVVGCALLQHRSGEEELQLPSNTGLPDELLEALGAKCPLECELGLGGEHRVGEVEIACLDRKSTRLHSSHVKTS